MIKAEYETIIIGGGASGTMLASMLSKAKKEALIISMQQIGKKLLGTGNGRCNLTNKNLNSNNYNTNIDNFLHEFTFSDTIEYFKEIGLLTIYDSEGRVYPISQSAQSVVNMLNYSISDKYITKLENERVIEIASENNEYRVRLESGKEIRSKKVVIATSPLSASLVEKYTGKLEYSPSIVGLKGKTPSNLDGKKLPNAKVTLVVLGKKFTEYGEVLFRKNGLSGIVIMNLSRHLARQKDYNGEIEIDMLPKISEKELEKLIESGITKDINPLDGVIHPEIAKEIMKMADRLNEAKPSKSKNDKTKQIISLIKRFRVVINGYLDNNQVMAGGISLKALTENLESIKHKNMYFMGEIIDVDGECGGYNLQWAWTSAYIVSRAIVLN